MRLLKPIVIALLFASSAALAETAANIQGMPIRHGDTVEKIQDAYKTTMVPEPFKTPDDGSRGLRLKTKGVWFFFDKSGKIDNIRLDAPFKGSVNGVKIGDSTARMREVLGEPAKTVKPPFGGFVYYIDDRTTARINVDSDDNIETIFLIK